MCTEKMKKIGVETEDEGEEMVKFIFQLYWFSNVSIHGTSDLLKT